MLALTQSAGRTRPRPSRAESNSGSSAVGDLPDNKGLAIRSPGEPVRLGKSRGATLSFVCGNGRLRGPFGFFDKLDSRGPAFLLGEPPPLIMAIVRRQKLRGPLVAGAPRPALVFIVA